MKNIENVYTGCVADEYDARRIRGQRWQRENAVIEPMLRRIPAGSQVLDIAAGTGRWLSLYKDIQVKPILLDSSADMLAKAQAKADAMEMCISVLVRGAADTINFPHADWAVVSNFFNWISLCDVQRVLNKVKASGIPAITFMISYLPSDTSWRGVMAARRKVIKKNLKSIVGLSDRGIYHLHSEAAVRSMLAGIGLTVVEEVTIVKGDGRQNIMIEGRFA